MHLTLRIALAFALFTASSCKQGSQHPSRQSASTPCQVADVFLRKWLIGFGPGSYVFSNRPQVYVEKPKNWWGYEATEDENITRPANALVDAALELHQHSAGRDCPSVQELLEKRHISFEKPNDAADQAKLMGENGLWPITFIQLSLPAISADGTTAVLMASSISGPVAGSGAFYLLQRQPNADWEIVGSAGTWVS